MVQEPCSEIDRWDQSQSCSKRLGSYLDWLGQRSPSTDGFHDLWGSHTECHPGWPKSWLLLHAVASFHPSSYEVVNECQRVLRQHANWLHCALGAILKKTFGLPLYDMKVIQGLIQDFLIVGFRTGVRSGTWFINPEFFFDNSELLTSQLYDTILKFRLDIHEVANPELLTSSDLLIMPAIVNDTLTLMRQWTSKMSLIQNLVIRS